MNFASGFVNYGESDSEDELSVSEEELEEGVAMSNMLMAPSAPAARAAPQAMSFGAPRSAPPVLSRAQADVPPPAASGGGGLFSRIKNAFSFGGGSADASDAAQASSSVQDEEAAMHSARQMRLQTRAKKKMARKRGGGRSKVVHRVRMDANVVNVDLSVLADPANRVVPRDPIFCENPKCRVALSAVDEGNIVYYPAEAAKVGFDLPPSMGMWTCKFCGFRQAVPIANKGEESEMLEGNSQDFLLAPPANEGKVDAGNTITILCVDVSGSMCVTQPAPGKFKLKGNRDDEMAKLNRQFGDHSDQWLGGQNRNTTYVSRLQAVQAACDAQLEELARTNPNARVGLVTFAGDVTVIGDGTVERKTISGVTLDDQAKLQEIGKAFPITNNIAQAKETLQKAIWGLAETGPTALGPALITSVAMASQQRGSRVLLCTDGLANVGLGSLEDIASEKVKTSVENWYSGVGNYAQFSGVTVDVVSIVDDGCDLEVLGTVAELSQGNVDQINPLELQKNFRGIMENPVLATNVRATMYLHSALRFRGEDAIRNASAAKAKPAPKPKAKSAPPAPKKKVSKASPLSKVPEADEEGAEEPAEAPAKPAPGAEPAAPAPKAAEPAPEPAAEAPKPDAPAAEEPKPAAEEPKPDAAAEPQGQADHPEPPAEPQGQADHPEPPAEPEAPGQGEADQQEDAQPGAAPVVDAQPGADQDDLKENYPDGDDGAAPGAAPLEAEHDDQKEPTPGDEPPKFKVQVEQELNSVPRTAQDVGNVTRETECYFEYGINREVIKKFGKLDKVPFQVQIHYTKLDGSRMIRIITQQQDATQDREQVERSVDVRMMGRHFAAKSASLAQRGDYEASRAVNFSSARYMDKVAHTSEQQRAWSSYVTSQNDWDGTLQTEQRREARESPALRFSSVQERSRARKSARSKRDVMSAKMYKMKRGKY